MPIISESELPQGERYPCSECDLYEGAIFLCGSGYVCESCFAEAAGIPEEEIFSKDEIDKRILSRAKVGLMAKTDG